MASRRLPPLWAVIMAGGRGARFWPVSRAGRPKQFLPPGGGAPHPRGRAGRRGEPSLLSETVRRLKGLIPPERTVVIASAAHRRLVREALPDLPPSNLIFEPEGRNTAPCLGLAAHLIESWEPGAILAAFPADQHIGRPAVLRKLVRAAAGLAHARGAIVTLGLKPLWPETGYGYIQRGRRFLLPGGTEAYAVARFTEKPSPARARRYAASGEHYWNGGFFIWRADRAIEEIDRHLPATGRRLREAATALRRRRRKDFERAFLRCESISIDHAVMERTRGLVVLPADLDWSDLGSWTALRNLLPLDPAGNLWMLPRRSTAVQEGARNLVVRSSKPLVAAIGVRDLVVIETADALLICSAEQAQAVSDLVKRLGAEGLERFL